MPTSATGIWNNRRTRGFTLLELLVVLFIVGLITGFAVLSIGRPSGVLEQEARRLQALIQLAAQEAVLSGQELALQFTAGGYTFLVREGGQWQPLAEDETLRPREFPDALRLSLLLEGSAMGDGKHPALVLILSSGEMTPFEATLRLDEDERFYRLTGAITGQVLLEAGEERG